MLNPQEEAFMPSVRQVGKCQKISARLNRQLTAYALVAGAAGVSALALTGAADAKVVYTSTHQVTRAHVPLYIDLNHDGINDFLLRTTYYVGSSYYKAGLSASGNHNASNAVAARRSSRTGYFFSAASALPAGARIGPGLKFSMRHPVMAEDLFPRDAATSQYSDLGQWISKGKGVGHRYLGLKFVINGEVHYGWARISVTVAHHRQYDDVVATLTGYAYETVADKPITAGQTTGADVIKAHRGSLRSLALGKE